jgi:hypothetical protein
MTTLIDAFNALEERKKAVLGDDPGLTFSASAEADALIMSGFDLDHSEVDALGVRLEPSFSMPVSKSLYPS